MTDTLAVALSVGGSLIGAFGTLWLTQRSERRRWLAGHFIGRKIDALANLHLALEECYHTIHLYSAKKLRTYEEFLDKVQAKEDAYLRAKTIADLYLEPQERGVMADALGALRQAGVALYLGLPPEESHANPESYSVKTREIDWTGLDESYEKAFQCLETILNPYELSQIR